MPHGRAGTASTEGVRCGRLAGSDSPAPQAKAKEESDERIGQVADKAKEFRQYARYFATTAWWEQPTMRGRTPTTARARRAERRRRRSPF